MEIFHKASTLGTLEQQVSRLNAAVVQKKMSIKLSLNRRLIANMDSTCATELNKNLSSAMINNYVLNSSAQI